MEWTRVQNFIDGRWQAPQTGAYLSNLNPATGEVFSEIPRSGVEDVNSAVRSAEQAFPAWARRPVDERAAYLREMAAEIEKRADEFAEMESRDQGKPVTLARRMDVERAIQNFRFFATEVLKFQDENYLEAGFSSRVQHRPLGVAGLIAPWNLPLYLLTWKIAPALACGNTVVAKPSEFTSMTAALLAEVALKVGLPAGVLNLVFGLGDLVGETLVRHPRVPLISFTGGTQTGRRIYQNSAEHFKKLSLELGGKNPSLIFADCDLERALHNTLRSSFLNQGEICLCSSRLYVEEKIFPQFVEKFIALTRQLKVGDPKSSDSFMGALISQAHLDKVLGFIATARSEGGEILCGGKRPELPAHLHKGFFLEPTVIAGLPETSRCNQEEIFGPVVTISSFRNESEAVEKANGVRYGLSATVWSENLEKARRLAASLNVGTVWINDWLLRDLRVPFGGMKESGLGREGGRHSLEFYTEATTVVVRE